MSTEQITAWQRAAERAGGTSAGMTAQLKESAAEIARLKSGMGASEGMQWFFRMGGSADDLKDGNTYLLARSKIIAGIFKTDPTKAALMASQMGISEDQFNLIKQGPEAIQSLVSAQMRHAAISREDAATMLVLKNKYSDFKDTVSDVSQSIIVKLAPTFEKILDQLNKLAIWVEDHKDDIKAWLDATIPKIEKLFKSFADGNFDSTTKDLIKMGKAFGDVADVILKIIGLLPKLDDSAFIKSLNGLFGSGDTTIKPGSIADKLGKVFNWGNVKELFTNTANAGLVGTPKNMPADSASVVQQLMRSGWTQAQAAGLAANFVHESNLNPNAVGDNGAAYGIGQWHADRQAEFKKKFGKDIRQSTLEEQIAFADYELRQGNETAAGKKLGGATTAAEAGAIVSKHYERPADKEGEAQKRAASAAALDASIKSDNALAAARVPTGASASAPVSGAAGNSTSTTDVKVGQINVQTQATDASGIAKSIGNAVAKHSFANQANTGLA
ncbi:hypothetical protein GN109_05990 [Collimonas pratensis]|nr:hypothetical protein [Collimonas pratensis]